MNVLVVGDANVDLEIRLPAGARTTHANPDPIMSGGGSAANTAAALARLGVATRFVGSVGDDQAGRYAIESLVRSGVDVTGVQTTALESTVMVIVAVPPDGERLIYVWPPRGGAHGLLDERRAIDAVAGADWLHVSGICLRVTPAREAIFAAMETANRAGIPVSLDLNLRLENWGWEDGFRGVILAAVDRADVVLGAAHTEICQLGGHRDPLEAASALGSPTRVVVARLGAGGAFAIGAEGVVRAPGFSVEVVDTVGAGDAFDAGFIAATLDGLSLSDSLAWGNAVAALTIGKPGSRSTPSRAELAEFLGR